MCLDRITENVPPVKEGYKVFRTTRINGILEHEYVQCRNRKIGKWYWAQPLWRRLLHHEKVIGNDCPVQYVAGFHVFNSLDDARAYIRWTCTPVVIVKVLLEMPICTGTQSGYPITVARRIKIVEIVES